ncbi:MAG: glycerol-3-phosphate acyltransferase, partial [Atopostipes suicloacalis]|nr:glycerol-3-phosphate acyltransferase [Atopostipes suicloacalis]
YLLTAVLFFLMILFITSTVSIASISASILAAVLSLFLSDPIFSVVVWIIAFGIVYLHRENINRIREGTESQVPFGLKAKDK